MTNYKTNKEIATKQSPNKNKNEDKWAKAREKATNMFRAVPNDEPSQILDEI